VDCGTIRAFSLFLWYYDQTSTSGKLHTGSGCGHAGSAESKKTKNVQVRNQVLIKIDMSLAPQGRVATFLTELAACSKTQGRLYPNAHDALPFPPPFPLLYTFFSLFSYFPLEV